MTETSITPERDPDEEPVFIDDHGPAFPTNLYEDESPYTEAPYFPFEEHDKELE